MRFENIDFEGTFGRKITKEELWWLVKVIRHCRQYCRNNAALKNYLAREFRDFNFSMEEKTNKKGEDYMGLVITEKHNV